MKQSEQTQRRTACRELVQISAASHVHGTQQNKADRGGGGELWSKLSNHKACVCSLHVHQPQQNKDNRLQPTWGYKESLQVVIRHILKSLRWWRIHAASLLSNSCHEKADRKLWSLRKGRRVFWDTTDCNTGPFSHADTSYFLQAKLFLFCLVTSTNQVSILKRNLVSCSSRIYIVDFFCFDRSTQCTAFFKILHPVC